MLPVRLPSAGHRTESRGCVMSSRRAPRGRDVLGRAIVAALLVLARGPVARPQATPGAEAREDRPPRILARINDETITRADLTHALTIVYGDEVLQQLINTKLLEQEARRAGPEVLAGFQQELDRRVGREAEARLAALARDRGYRTAAAFQEAMDRTEPGAYDRLKKHQVERLAFFIRPRLLAERILRTRIEITDKDVAAAYERMFGPRMLVRQIVVRTRAEAEALLNRLRSGADFAQLASEKSVDPVSGRRGGLMEPLPNEGVLGRAAFKMKVGGLSRVIKTDEGYHILKLERKIPRRRERLEEVRDLLRQRLLRDEIERRIPDLLLEIRQRSRVKVDY